MGAHRYSVYSSREIEQQLQHRVTRTVQVTQDHPLRNSINPMLEIRNPNGELVLVGTGKVKGGSQLGQSRGALGGGEKPGRIVKRVRRVRRAAVVGLRLSGLEDSVRELETIGLH